MVSRPLVHILGVLTIDFYVPDLRLGIEVDGPSHFVSSPDGLRLSGTTKAKHRVLRHHCDHFFQVTGNLAQGNLSIDEVMDEIQLI